MDGLGDEVASTDAVEDVHLQNKEGEYVVKPGILLSGETVPADRNSPGSSLYVLEDILEHRNGPRNSGLEDVFEHAFGSLHDLGDRGDVVEELTVRSINGFSLPIVGTSSGSELAQTTQNQKQNVNQSVGGSGNGTTYCNRDTSQALSGIFENAGHTSIPESLDKRSSSDDHSIAVKQFISQTNGVSSSTPPHGGIKSKFLSRSGFSHFFGRTAMKGEGVMRRGQTHDSLRTEPGVQNNTKSSGGPPVASNAILNTVGGSMVASHSSQSLGAETASISSCNDGVSLRYWLKAECHKASKAKRMHVFKQIVDLVEYSHSQGVVLHDLKPSFFKLLQFNQIKYIGGDIQKDHLDIQYVPLSRPGFDGMQAKRQKLNENPNLKRWPSFQSRHGFQMETRKDRDIAMTGTHFSQDGSHERYLSNAAQQQSIFLNERLEDRWYVSPEELNGGVRTISSNIYSLGVLLFELLCHFDSEGARAAAMLDLRHRIFPPNFLSQNLKEAGFCLQLLHPEPLLRPTARDILESEVMNVFQEMLAKEMSSSIEEEDADVELLHHFLVSLNEQKQKHASKLLEDIEYLEADIKELEKRRRSKNSLSHFSICAKENGPLDKDLSITESCTTFSPGSCADEMKLMRNIGQLENAYFSVRSKIKLNETDSTTRPDKEVLQSRENLSFAQNNEAIEKPTDCVGAFFDGLYKYARYSKFEVRGLLRSGEFSKTANVICSLGFDRDEDYFAAAGVSRKIKIFEFNAFFNDSVDIHYPVVEMENKSKVSCISWNSYIKSYLASADYDGVVKLWDASTGQVVNQYKEHVKRAWSVDFSRVYPTKLASCSDDYTVKLWGINEQNSLGTIRNVANVCCVQFSAHSTHMLAFGSADCKTYCYDLRNARVPWCVLSGHDRTVSYMKFLDSETLVTASTDNTLKLWDLNKSNCSRPSSACSLTFTGHTNEKNFVGLSVADGFIACGSESNEVYSYHRSLPMPITSHKFGSIDPITGKETDDDNGLFVSSVCWRGNSDMLVAANSSGCIKVLQMV